MYRRLSYPRIDPVQDGLYMNGPEVYNGMEFRWVPGWGKNPYVAGPSRVGVGALFARGVTETCEGNERSYPDGEDCCPDTTWSNATYGRIKGYSSLRRWNEKRVWRALELFIEQEVRGVAWDAGIPDSAVNALVLRLNSASSNFAVLYPPERWYKNEKASRTSCTADGYYSAWYPSKSTDPSAYAVYERLTGGKSYSVDGAENDYGHAVIDSVPGSEPGSGSRSMPLRSQLYWVEGGAIVISPWTKAFIDTFAPIQASAEASKYLLDTSKLVMNPAVLNFLRAKIAAAQTVETGPEDEPKVSLGPALTNRAILIGVGAVAVAAAVYYYQKK